MAKIAIVSWNFDHFWAIPSHELWTPKYKKRLITRSSVCGLLVGPQKLVCGEIQYIAEIFEVFFYVENFRID